MTKSEKLYEYTKCLKDPIYTIESHLQTFDATQGSFVKFKLFPKQKEIISSYKSNRFNIVMKPRQAGVSTTTAAYIAVLAALSDSKSPQRVLILANKQETAMEFLKKIKDFIQQLPEYFRFGAKDWFDKEKNSAKHIRLFNGSEIKAVATSMDALRGYTPTLLVMDEAAYIDNGDEVYGAAQPALSTGGGAILISTPNGRDPLYYTTYENAREGKNGFNIIEMRWYQDPRYNQGLSWIKRNGKDEIIDDIKETDVEKYEELKKKGYEPTSPWFETMCGQLNHDPRKIAQELSCSFLSSGDNVIDQKYVNNQRDKYQIVPVRKEWADGNMWIWEEPTVDHQYILAADPSSGSSDDFAAMTIYDFTTGFQVAEYHGKITPDVLGEVCAYYGKRYDAYVVVDTTGGYGSATILKLLELEYPVSRMHYDVHLGTGMGDASVRALEKHIMDGKLPGMNINKHRSTMISELERSFRMEELKVRSVRSLNEMDTFVFKNNRPDHMKGSHDDCLFALAMCVFVGMSSFKLLEKSKGQAKVMAENWVVSTNEIQDNPVLSEVSHTNNLYNQRSNTITPNTVQQFSWLFAGMR